MFRAYMAIPIILAATAFALPFHAGSAELAQAGGGAKPLTKDEIRGRIIGNTLQFTAPSNGRIVNIYFGQNGEVFQKVADRSKIFKKKWFFNKKSMLCRTFGKNNRKACTKVKPTGKAARVILFNQKVSYQAAILPGRQLSGQPKNVAGAGQSANALAGGGARRAQKAGGPPPPATVIRNMDKNGDQRVSRNEFRGPAQKFSKIDANQDGFLDLAEFQAARKRGAARPNAPGGANAPNGPPGGPGKGGAPNAKKIVQKMDQNGDGKLSKTEFRGPPQKFRMMDQNKDGFVTGQELAAGISKGRAGGGGGPGKGNGGGQKKSLSLGQKFAMMDANGDGDIARSEWRGPKDRFKRLDRDRDGVLSSDEIKKVVKRGNQAPLRTLAMKAYNVPESTLETRTGRTDCVFDNKEYSFKYFEISRYSPNCTLGGSILFVDSSDREWPMIYEISRTGELIWEYNVTSNVPLGSRDMKTHAVMDPSRLANGNTLYLIKHYGIFEVNRAGKTVWNYLDSGISHDVDRLRNGNTLYVRGWVSQGEDHLREVTRSGKRIWSWNGVDQFKEPEFQPQTKTLRELDRKHASSMEMSLPGHDGWFHSNAVTRAPDGTTMLSIRNFHRVVFIKPSGGITKSIPIGFTHDPELLANGNILVNIPIDGVAEYSGTNVIWRWGGKNWEEKTGRKEDNLWFPCDANLLPNGNIFIVGGKRMMEIDAAGQVVWQLLNTKIGKIGPKAANSDAVFYKAQRIGPDGRGYGE